MNFRLLKMQTTSFCWKHFSWITATRPCFFARIFVERASRFDQKHFMARTSVLSAMDE